MAPLKVKKIMPLSRLVSVSDCPERARPDAAVQADAQHQPVHHGEGRNLGRRAEPGDDAADQHHRHQQRQISARRPAATPLVAVLAAPVGRRPERRARQYTTSIRQTAITAAGSSPARNSAPVETRGHRAQREDGDAGRDRLAHRGGGREHGGGLRRVVALAAEALVHRNADRRHVGGLRAGNAGRDIHADDRDLQQPAAEMAEQRDRNATMRAPMPPRSMMKPARMKNGSARKMKPPVPRCALLAIATIGAAPVS